MTDERTRTFTWDDPLATAAEAQGRTGLEFIQGLVDGRIPPPPIARLMDFTVEEA